ncbi:uncharacterized protein BCR38DRAFT_483953 [Pseudomassariella vexata]|uniref:BZIP domain-containing protein n=1 Tax=Pseudomassariella vexata TaxID=1141098 RepID=A0A1Y2E4N7_9PEZI|nr:uncharacterized protein BCR38DRAFT_483953 [Pseudomassariella vexata]ORY66314.1 hypothetical protein BCR38DRAFT_483953 [Pseudomassariella vexata]
MAEQLSPDRIRLQNRESQRRFRQRHKQSRRMEISGFPEAWQRPVSPASTMMPNNEIAGNTTFVQKRGQRSAFAHNQLQTPSHEVQAWTPSEHNPAFMAAASEIHERSMPQGSPVHVHSFPQMPLMQMPLDSNHLGTGADTGAEGVQEYALSLLTAKESTASAANQLVEQNVAGTQPAMGNNEVLENENPIQSHRRLHRETSPVTMTRAEEMISNVESLYDFGVDLGIVTEDPRFLASLQRLKDWFTRLQQCVSEDSLLGQMSQERNSDTDW